MLRYILAGLGVSRSVVPGPALLPPPEPELGSLGRRGGGMRCIPCHHHQPSPACPALGTHKHLLSITQIVSGVSHTKEALGLSNNYDGIFDTRFSQIWSQYNILSFVGITVNNWFHAGDGDICLSCSMSGSGWWSCPGCWPSVSRPGINISRSLGGGGGGEQEREGI